MTIGLRFTVLALAAALASGTAGCAASGGTAPADPLPGQGAYRRGERHGRWSFFYLDGALLAEGEFTKGRPSGEWSYWYEDGSPFLHGERNPAPTGEWFVWTREGSLCEERSEMRCDGWKLVWSMAGFGEFDFARIEGWSRDRADVLFGWSPFSWNGTWVYAGRDRVGALSVEGRRRAGQIWQKMRDHARASLPRPP